MKRSRPRRTETMFRSPLAQRWRFRIRYPRESSAAVLGRRSRGRLARALSAGYDLIVFDAASHVTAFLRKYDSLAMRHAIAALLPNTASSVTGLRDFTDSKNTFKCGRMSSQSCPL